MSSKQLIESQSRSSERRSPQDAGYLETLESVVSSMWKDVFHAAENCVKKEMTPHQKIQEESSVRDESTTKVPDIREKSNLDDASGGVSIVYRNLGPCNYSNRSNAVGTSDTHSDFDDSEASFDSKQMSSILIDHNYLGAHKRPKSEKSALDPSIRFTRTALDSASLMPSLQKEEEQFPRESSAALPSVLRCTTANSVASHVSAEAPIVLHRPYDNQFQKASGERVIRQTKEPKRHQHSADELQQSTKCASSESSLPQETFVRAASCVYSDTDRGPIAGTLEEIHNVMLFLESFPRTQKYCNRDSTPEADKIRGIKREVGATQQQVKGRNVSNTQKVDLHEHGTHHSYTSPKHSERASSGEGHAVVPKPDKAERATAAAQPPVVHPPVVHPPRVPAAAAQQDGSESVRKSAEHKSSPGQRLLQGIKSTFAPGHGKAIVAVVTVFVLVLFVTVTWFSDYIFPPPTSDHKDTAEPLKASGANKTSDDEDAGGVSSGPFELLFTDVSILDINEEM